MHVHKFVRFRKLEMLVRSEACSYRLACSGPRHQVTTLSPTAAMIYDVASQRFAELVNVSTGGGGPKGGTGSGGNKMLKAKGSDGKYQGE